MAAQVLRNTLARAIGFAAGWACFAAALTAAARTIKLGPGFSNPAPYAAAAILVYALGRLIRFWLHEREPLRDPAPAGVLRRSARACMDGFKAFLRGPAAFNNFVFLSVAYFIGIGLSSLFVRKKTAAKNPATYWHDLHLGRRDSDAYYRPF